MATSALDVGDRVARQALVEKPEFVPSNDDLGPIFGVSSAPAPSPEVVTRHSQHFVWMDELKTRAYDKPSPATLVWCDEIPSIYGGGPPNPYTRTLQREES